ncbi:MAG: glycosyltransferase family 2 protein [Ignavibacteriales bacterium]|nr:glycosyltransferase family 2 protein [Ignavibacteriales bacterium]
MQPLVTVNILSYNRKDDLRNTLQKVFEQEYKNIEVIVVDNNSQDGSVEMVKSEFPSVHLLELQKNIGIAGWNEGAIIAKGKYLLFLDDDSYPEKDALHKCVPTMEQHPNCAVLALNVYNDLLNRDEMIYEDRVTFPSFVGCGVIVRRELFHSIGMFNKILFLYEHEIDFSIRTIQNGYDILFSPDSIVHHVYSSIHRHKQQDEKNDLRKQFFKNRNMILILLTYFPLPIVFWRIGRFIIGHILFGLVEGCLWPVIKGIASGLWVSSKNWHSRKIVSVEVQKRYGYGKFVGGFFHAGQYAFRRPRWLS